MSKLSILVLDTCSPVASLEQPKDLDVGGRIVGGVNQDISGRKFQVAVSPAGNMCGGSLIKWNYVITAAHCTYGLAPADISVYAGSSFFGEGLPKSVMQIIQHEQFNSSTNDFDISLLKLSSSYAASPTIGTINLALVMPLDGASLVVSGYGATEYDGEPAVQLMSANVAKRNFNSCNAAYGLTLTTNMLCAAASGKDSCQGDSGGPLTYNGQLLGVVSFGNDCADPAYPGVYTSIPALYGWIQTKILFN